MAEIDAGELNIILQLLYATGHLCMYLYVCVCMYAYILIKLYCFMVRFFGWVGFTHWGELSVAASTIVLSHRRGMP